MRWYLRASMVVGLVVFLAIVCACGGKILWGEESDAATCNPDMDAGPYMAKRSDCTPVVAQECQTWEQSLVLHGYAHATCVMNDLAHNCVAATFCGQDPNGQNPCGCGPTLALACPFGQVCVSDTPNGLPHCEPPCTP